MDRGSNSAPFRWIVAWCMFFGSPAPAAVPVAAFGNLPSIEQVALSPDGSTLAVIQTVHDQRLLAITNINDFKLVSAARVGDVRIREIEWADDEHYKEDHYLSRSATRLQMLQSSIAFLEKHNPPD
jgi:hypothetical protein